MEQAARHRERIRGLIPTMLNPERRIRHREGTLDRIEGFQSRLLVKKRNVVVYLPPNYNRRSEAGYPILLMQDGQNLFDPETAFVPGKHWRLREAADGTIRSGVVEPLIIVGIENAGVDRIHEYTPTHDVAREAGGKAAHYGRMLIEELLPMLRERYRVAEGSRRVGVGGSSLGALVSLYLALQHPDVFGRAGVMSPAAWWGDRAILQQIDVYTGPERPRLWLDIGAREGRDAVADARMVRDRLRARGWTAADLHYREESFAEHDETAWANRAPAMLQFLFPATEPPPLRARRVRRSSR
jgi:predicted alpha/beta superfamily hydrolase